MSAGALGSYVFDFTSLDQNSVQSDLTTFAQQTFPADLWTDFNQSNFETFQLEQMAYCTDLLAYNANAQALEVVVATLVVEQNFRNISKTTGYVLKSASPSSGTLQCVLDPLGTYPFNISAHLEFSPSGTVIVFQPTATVAVGSYPAGGIVNVPVIQGQEFFNEAMGTTNGQPGQTMTLANTFMIDGTLTVTIAGVVYSLVPNFIQSAPTDQSYTIATDQNGVTTVTFGDGINGTIPPKNQTPFATYKTGGGTATNISNGTAVKPIGTSDGSVVPAQILSASFFGDATGGGPKQTLANAKANLPAALKANDRCVTLADYAAETIALVPGIVQAQAIAGKPFGGSTPVLLLALTSSGGDPSDVLKNIIVTALAPKKMAGKRIRVLNNYFVTMNIAINAYVLKNNVAATVAAQILAIILNEFVPPTAVYGMQVALQFMYDLVDPDVVPGVDHCFFTTFSVLPYFARHVNSPTTGNGTVANIVTNVNVNRREWLIRVQGPNPPTVNVNQFIVLQRRLGTNTAVSDNLVTDAAGQYLPNELVTGGYVYHPRPEEQTTTFGIIGNTATTITTVGGMLVVTSPNDAYVVERTETMVGKILRTTLTAPAVATTSLTVASNGSFQVGDVIRLTSGTTVVRAVIAGFTGGTGITTTAPVTIANGATVDFVWVSNDGTVEFSVVDGSTPLVVGDEIYVDTYAQVGDVKLRAENFPQISGINVSINTVGGI